MGTPSSIGYGKNPYGHSHGGSPFKRGGTFPYPMDVGYGLGDWGEEVTWRLIPEFYRDEDGTEGQVPEPLRGFIDAIKPLLNSLIKTWRSFPDLWDAQRVPLEQLPALAYNVGYEVDSSKPERLQRAEVLNAPLLYVNKGTDLGYEILAAFEDQLVQITPLWAASKEPGSALTPDDPTEYFAKFDDIPADLLQCDQVFPNQFAIWPKPLYLGDDCRTNLLRLTFFPVDNPSQDFDATVASRVADRLLRFKPLHVEIDRITFDGLRGSSQTWMAQGIVADAVATGHWCSAVLGTLQASSQTWCMPVQADTV